MKKVITILFLSFTCIFPQTTYVYEILNQVNPDSIKRTVEDLSGENVIVVGGQSYTIQSRYRTTSGNAVAADYIKQRLQDYGLAVYDQTFGTLGRNVYAVKTGTQFPDQKYFICAHYDSYSSNQNLAPGADDNASGTAVVIEAARILRNYSSAYTIVFALWDEEEIGLVGSQYYANQAYSTGENIKGVINIDMIGWDGNNDGKVNIHTRNVANSVQLANSLFQFNTDYTIGLAPFLKNPGSTFSDHASFWNYNYTAVLIIEDDFADFNAYYHTPNDLIQYFNEGYFLKCTKLGIGSLAEQVIIQGLVPVELVAFSASAEENKVILNWETASEINNYGFEVQFAANNDENDFRTIGFINGKGNSTQSNYYQFVHENVSGKFYYRLKQVDFNGQFEYSNIIEVETVPAEFYLSQNYPNPFNPVTNISFVIGSFSGGSFVTLKVFDVLGNEVAELVNEELQPGTYEIIFDGSKLASGIYFYNLTAGNFKSTKKLILTK